MSSTRAKSVSSIVSDVPFVPTAGNKDMALVQARVLAAKAKIEATAFEAIGLKKVAQNVLIPGIVKACPDLTPATVAIILRGDAPPTATGAKRGRKPMTEEQKQAAKADRELAKSLLANHKASVASAS